jgi:hypothetical protein
VAVLLDSQGRVREGSLVGFCQGPVVTREIDGRVVSFHQFAGLSFAPEVSEPYLLLLPELDICPPAPEFN